jgi:hypothetical protein
VQALTTEPRTRERGKDRIFDLDLSNLDRTSGNFFLSCPFVTRTSKEEPERMVTHTSVKGTRYADQHEISAQWGDSGGMSGSTALNPASSQATAEQRPPTL